MRENFFDLFLETFINYLPLFLWALFVFCGGCFVATLIKRLVGTFFKKIHLDSLFKRVGWEGVLKKFHLGFSLSQFFAEVVRVFFVIIFLMLTAEILSLHQFAQFLEKVISYYLNIFIASFIFIGACILVDFSQKIVVGTLKKEKITYSQFLGKGISWIIWVFSFLAILYQLQIASRIILTIFVGLVITISLALGISFGLGGKEIARRILNELEEKLK